MNQQKHQLNLDVWPGGIYLIHLGYETQRVVLQ
jgi:hypothetical protein